jgi:transcriptional regulator with XRE-family HTH domain
MAKPARRLTYIKQWREFRELTQEQLAEMTNMSPGNLSLIERGLQNYTQDTLEAIAHALKCSPSDLLDRDPNDAESIWTVWERAKPAERDQIVEIAKTITKRRAR